MAVLFLDVDGVLNTRIGGSFSALHDSLLLRLRGLLERTQADVVLSSSWRHDPERMDHLRRIWKRMELPVIRSVTPINITKQHAERQRLQEIFQWLRAHPDVKRWAAVDDIALQIALTKDEAHLSDRLVQTNAASGLSVDVIEALVRQLGDSQDVFPPLTLSWEEMVLQKQLDVVVIVTLVEDGTQLMAVDVCAMQAIGTTTMTMSSRYMQWMRWLETVDHNAVERARVGFCIHSGVLIQADDTDAFVWWRYEDKRDIRSHLATTFVQAKQLELMADPLRPLQLHAHEISERQTHLLRKLRERVPTDCGLQWLLTEYIIRHELTSVGAVDAIVCMLQQQTDDPSAMIQQLDELLVDRFC